ncbi:MAG: hypothetical protein WBC13_16035 [Dokdonella sp.]|uniref:hypothetical protein n=1 Tax=Dokdonella sp. TaxID=2291710 RepID=UPI0025C06C5D|nr:hypothetical protein [Dokdonella sp.]MBK8122707.1 hypothetical protein [Dokdonella sp.]
MGRRADFSAEHRKKGENPAKFPEKNAGPIRPVLHELSSVAAYCRSACQRPAPPFCTAWIIHAQANPAFIVESNQFLIALAQLNGFPAPVIPNATSITLMP